MIPTEMGREAGRAAQHMLAQGSVIAQLLFGPGFLTALPFKAPPHSSERWQEEKGGD